MPPLLTTKQAALKLSVKPCTVRSLVRIGRLPCIRLSKRLFLFREVDLEKWAERNAR